MKEVKLTFHNNGLRSYIDVDLCSECPRQDDKGCCGYYSPVFYPSDFAYLIRCQPELLEEILSLSQITVLDASVTVNHTIEAPGYHCYFHNIDGGCRLPQLMRESICRHFVCPGITWERDEKFKHWKNFFAQLSDYEIELNNKISAQLKSEGLTLRDLENRTLFFKRLVEIFDKETSVVPDFIRAADQEQSLSLTCEIKYGEDWIL
ncbi:MAG: hypothetical protein PHD40_02350 [Syntrophomonadaceae bacterium]|nr:hypothetical protein [Syntrophomonadaceae bacterium]